MQKKPWRAKDFMSKIDFKELVFRGRYQDIFERSNDTEAKIAILLGAKYIQHVLVTVNKLTNYYKIQLNVDDFFSRTYVFADFILTEYITPYRQLRILYYKGRVFKYTSPVFISCERRILLIYKIYEFFKTIVKENLTC